MTSLPYLEFDASNFAERDRFDAAGDMYRNYLTFASHPGPASRFTLRTQFWWLGSVSLIHSVTSPMSYFANVVREGEPLVVISLLLRGGRDYVWDDQHKHLSPEYVHVTHSRDQSLWECEQEEALALHVPPSRLSLLPGQMLRSRSIPTASPLGAIMRSMLLNLKQTLENSSLAEGIKLSEAICSFLEPVLRDTPDLDARSVNDMKRAGVLRYIEENISDHSLGPDRLCTVFGMSRATLYRLFDDTEGVMAHIAQLRIQRIHNELARSKPRRGLVRAVAEKYGFHDMSHLNRMFRRHMGTTPGSVAGSLMPELHRSAIASPTGKPNTLLATPNIADFVGAIRKRSA